MLPPDYEDRPLSALPIAVVDTETTGLYLGLGHRVVEVAMLRLENMQETARFSRLVNPGRAMDPGASSVNGITDADLVDAPPFAAILPELHDLLHDAIIVAHNAAFDAGFLGMEYYLAGFMNSSPEIALPQLDNPWLCTMLLARRFFHFERNSLGNIARELRVRSSRAHRALNDVYTTTAVLKRMAMDLDRMGFHTAGDLLHAQGGAVYSPDPPRPLQDSSFEEAITRQTYMRIRYQGKSEVTERVIRPLYLADHNGRAYLIAYCTLRQAQRSFRLDRIHIIT